MKRALLTVAGLGLGLVACAEVMNVLEEATDPNSVEGQAVRGVNRIRKSFQDLDPSEEHYIGRSVAAAVLSLPEYPLAKADQTNAYMNRIGATIVASSDAVRHTFAGYHFALLESKEVNAFACPGGTVFVTRGLVEKCENEDELACVLAHEIAHVTHKHGLAAIKEQNFTEGFKYLGGAAAKATLSDQDLQAVTNVFGDSIQDVIVTMVRNGYSKEAEYESDKSGTAFAAAAGYDPSALQNVLARMKEAGGHGGMMSTHPAPQDRSHELGMFPAVVPSPDGLDARAARFKTAMQ